MGAAKIFARYSESELVPFWKTSLGDDLHPASIASKKQTLTAQFRILTYCHHHTPPKSLREPRTRSIKQWFRQVNVRSLSEVTRRELLGCERR